MIHLTTSMLFHFSASVRGTVGVYKFLHFNFVPCKNVLIIIQLASCHRIFYVSLPNAPYLLPVQPQVFNESQPVPSPHFRVYAVCHRLAVHLQMCVLFSCRLSDLLLSLHHYREYYHCASLTVAFDVAVQDTTQTSARPRPY